MPRKEILQESINYIENYIKSELSVTELAALASYSVYHYSRLFSSAIGCSAAEYILRRRLEHIAARITAGDKPTDIIMEYGFNTYAGFYKAFLRRYGCSPKQFVSIYKKYDLSNPEVVIIYSQEELKSILKNWDIPDSPKLQAMIACTEPAYKPHVWKVNDDYMLKAGEKSALLKEITLAKRLHEQGFCSALPVMTHDHKEYAEGSSAFVLVQAIRGLPLASEACFGVNHKSFAAEYGRAIAGLHHVLSKLEKDGTLYDETDLFSDVVNWAIPKVKQQNIQWKLQIPEQFFTDYQKQHSLFKALPMQLIHRDPNPGNILFDNDKVSSFIDFDLTERNIRLFDPCYCATGLLSESRNLDPDFDTWLHILEALLKSYDRISPLTPDEKKAVYYVISSIQLIFIAWLPEHTEFKDMLEKNRKMLQLIVEHKDQITGIFGS